MIHRFLENVVGRFLAWLNPRRHQWAGTMCLVAHVRDLFRWSILMPGCLRCEKCGYVEFPYLRKCEPSKEPKGWFYSEIRKAVKEYPYETPIEIDPKVEMVLGKDAIAKFLSQDTYNPFG